MMAQLSGAVIRVHGPLSLRLWDRLMRLVGLAFIALSLPLFRADETESSMVALSGGLLILWHCRHEHRVRTERIWAMAADAHDPVEALALHEYLYALRFGDLFVVSEWRQQRDALGLPVDYFDLDAPPQVRAIGAHLARVPREDLHGR